jgi:uncharacterized protein (TIGR02453 family)
MAFSGFPRETFEFLAGLAEHNSKAWFEAHRDDYEAYYAAPAKLFVEAIGPKLKAISKTVSYEPKINGSIFRINRDVRFGKDKTPYKTHLDFWFWEGAHRGWETPGFFLRLTPSTMIAGAGMHAFSAAQLASYRSAVIDGKAGAELEKILAALGRPAVGGANRKTVPRGFDAGHRRAHLLLHDGLHAFHERPLPKTVHTAAFVAECLADFRAAAPVSKWLLAQFAR